MEKYIERAGGPLPALRQIIETDVGNLLHRNLPHINAVPKPERANVLKAVTDTLDEFLHCIQYMLFQTHQALPDVRAQRQYLSEYQRTSLQLLGHLLEYTQPVLLHRNPPPSSFKDACCYYLYHALNSLLDYTIQLGGGQLNCDLPLPPAARTLLQEIIVGDLAALRQQLEAVHVRPALADIVLAPFLALPDAYSVTFYHVHYLRTLQQALLQLPLPGPESTGEDIVFWTLVAQNFNTPRFISYFYDVAQRQLKACPTQEAWGRELDRYKTKVATDPGSSPLAWQPLHASVREQFTVWLERQRAPLADAVAPVRAPTLSDVEKSEDEDEEYEMDADGPYSPNDLTLRISPKILAVIANAARKLRFIFWGNDGKHIAEMVARIASVDGPLSPDTVRRGLSELETLRKAREVLQKIIDFFDRQIKAKEEKFFR